MHLTVLLSVLGILLLNDHVTGQTSEECKYVNLDYSLAMCYYKSENEHPLLRFPDRIYDESLKKSITQFCTHNSPFATKCFAEQFKDTCPEASAVASAGIGLCDGDVPAQWVTSALSDFEPIDYDCLQQRPDRDTASHSSFGACYTDGLDLSAFSTDSFSDTYANQIPRLTANIFNCIRDNMPDDTDECPHYSTVLAYFIQLLYTGPTLGFKVTPDIVASLKNMQP